MATLPNSSELVINAACIGPRTTMAEFGPQQFELEVSDIYHANGPDEPLNGITIRAIVAVTVNWNFKRTELTEKSVKFAAPIWVDAGAGPFTVFDDTLGGLKKPIGKVSYSVVTDFFHIVDADEGKGRFRWLITPYVKLFRTFTPSSGSAPNTEEACMTSDRLEGVWQQMPA